MHTSIRRGSDSVADTGWPHAGWSAPVFESPVVRFYPVKGGVLRMTDVSSTTKLLVRSDTAQFGIPFGRSGRVGPDLVGHALVCGSRPGEWLVLGERAACEEAVTAVGGEGFTNVIDHTHAVALFRLSGANAASLLEKVCSIDWTEEMMPNGAVVSASVAKVVSDLVRDDTAHTALSVVPSYLIACDRSLGQYLFDALLDAGAEFGVVVAG